MCAQFGHKNKFILQIQRIKAVKLRR